MKNRKWVRAKRIAVMVAALGSPMALMPTAVYAGIDTATIRGVVDAGSAQKLGVEITATNADTGYSVKTRSNANGDYALAGLPPGTYTVVAKGSDGTQATQTIVVRVGEQAELPLALGSQTPQRITIVGTTIREVKSPEVGTYVTPVQMQRLPQVTRNFLSFADLAPGVNLEPDTDGNVKIRSGATSRDTLNIFIDGVGQKDYVLRGGSTGQDTSRGNPFPQSAVAEYKVITQNYKAEYDQVTSAAITAVTKSGTNKTQGEVFWDHTTGAWRAPTPAEKAAGSKVDSSQDQYGVTVGGPIIENKAHYFVAYEGKDHKDPKTVATNNNFPVASLPSFAQGEVGPVTSPFKEDLVFAKVDWALDDANRIDFSLKTRHETDRKHLGGTETAAFSSNDKLDETRADLKHQHTADDWINEAHVTYEKAYWAQEPVNWNNGYRLMTVSAGTGTNGATETDVLSLGGNNYYQRKGQKGYSIQDDLTLTNLGTHLVKVGAKVKWITVDALEQSNGTPQFYYDAGYSLTLPYKVQFGAPIPGVGDGSISAKNTQYGIYAQDDYEYNNQLTLNLGIRWDYEVSPTYLEYTTPANVVAALRGWANINNANSGININDYISTGSNRSAFKDAFQPRLGFSYDLKADKQHVVYGGWGRSYDRNFFDVLQLERTKGTYAGYQIGFLGDPNYNNCSAASPTCVAWNASYLAPGGLAAFSTSAGAGREIDLLNNNLKMPYSDQFSLGIRDTIDIWQTEVAYTRTENKDGFVWTLGNRLPNGTFFAPNTSWGPPWGSGVPGFGSLILGTNGLRSTTDSVFFKADKPYTKASGWGTTFAYTYSDAKANHNYRADTFTYALDYPSPSNYTMLPSDAVSKHKLVVTGMYDMPWDILGAAKLTYSSPKPIQAVNCLVSAAHNASCKFDTVNGGSFKQLDLSISKGLQLGMAKVTLRADVLNVLNTKNYADSAYNTFWGDPGVPNPTFGTVNPNGELVGPTRTFKLGLSAAF